jgi:regulator of cell morphogenesis and NO signaling
MENIKNQTLVTIALSNHEFIPVLEKYGLDFCCRGKKTLAEACAEKNLPPEQVATELSQILRIDRKNMPFTEMTADELIAYITIHHHFYVRNSIPTIVTHIEKVANKHGDRYPYMKEVYTLFQEVIEDLLPHMDKEEKVLFPRIKRIAAAFASGQPDSGDSMLVTIPIQVLESEHDHAGQLMYKIRELTQQYTAPEDACTTFRICLEELRFFEQDLHQHVHLENNILFPMAKKMGAPKEIRSCSL